MTTTLRLLAVTGLLTLAGCATTLRVSDVSTAAPGADIGGVPFRVRAPYTVRVFERQPDGSYRQVLVQPADLPDPAVLYALNFDAAGYGNRSFEVRWNEDATLASVKFKTEDRTAEALAAAGKQATAGAEAVAGFDAKKKAAERAALQDQLDQEKARAALPDYQESLRVDREARVLAALEARNQAEAARRQLQDAGTDTTTSQRAALEDALRVAELKANQAARRAGLSEPYPGIAP